MINFNPEGIYYDEGFVYPEYYEDEWFEDARVNPCPDCDLGEVILGHIEGNTGHQTAKCSAGCGWSA